MGMLSLSLLGSPAVHHAGQPVNFATRKALALLIYLALEEGSHSREKLMALFWPESDTERARMALRRTLAYLRDAIDESNADADTTHILATRTELRFIHTRAETDVALLQEAWRQLSLALPESPTVSSTLLAQLQHALSRYRSDFLDGFSLSDAPDFDDWASLQREIWHHRMDLIYERLAQLQLDAQDYPAALDTGRRWIAHYPLNEAAHRHLMRSHYAAGNRPAALQSYNACQQVLKDELDAEPSPETEALVNQIRSTALPLRTSAAPQSSSAPPSAQPAPTRPASLPAPPNALIGRQAELATLHQDLHNGIRLLTLLGPPGIGKTRLAIQLAEQAAQDFSDGVCFVALASLSDPELLASAILQALEYQDDEGRAPLQRLKDELRQRNMLLVLDNFEHLQAAAAVVSELLAAAPLLSILVSSRSPLHIYGEHERPVQPLELPDLKKLPDAPDLAMIASVRLFLERAHAIRPDLRLSTESWSAIAAICVRLDGLPLAIELAAARVKSFSIPILLERLSTPLSILVDGPRDRSTRQQTLRGAIAWSDRLLSEEQRLVFAQLAVFTGGWTLAAAEAICAPEQAEPGAVAATLTALSEASMLSAIADRETELRYGMLQAIREYALEQLATRKLSEESQQRHTAYYLSLAEIIEPQLKGPEQGALLDQLEREHDNMRTALSWTLTRSQLELNLRLCSNLWWFWFVRGYLYEGRRWIEAALQLDQAQGQPEQYAALRLATLNGGGVLAHDQGDYGQASTLLEASLTLARQLNHQRGIGAALNNLGLVARSRGDYARAGMYYQESLQIARMRNDEWAVAVCLSNLGMVAAFQGQHRQAIDWYSQSLVLRRSMGDSRGIAVLLNSLADSMLAEGHADQAYQLYTESLDRQRALDDRAGMSDALYGLAQVALLRNDWDMALQQLNECMNLRQAIGDRRGIAECLESAAAAADGAGNQVRASTMLGAAQALRDSVGAPIPPVDLDAHTALVTRLRNGLGEDVFASAWVRGQAAATQQELELLLIDV